MITQTDYLHRHNRIANIIQPQQRLPLHHKLIQTQKPIYNPQTVHDNETAVNTILR